MELFLLALVSAGCGSSVSPQELGTVVYEVPQFDPIDQKYPLPKLKELSAGEASGHSQDGHDHSHDGHDHSHHGHDHAHDHAHP